MCGIAGIFHFDPSRSVDRRSLAQMGRKLEARGPDALGRWLEGPVGLEVRRLSIVDIVHGTQPMANESGTCVIAYNGELFNADELRRELEEAGYAFGTKCDSEVVLASYERFGNACFEKFDGQFACAIWDQNAHALFLARDQFGICPLYFVADNERIAFASEVKALLAVDFVAAEVNPSVLATQLAGGFIDDGESPFAGIGTIPPGTWLRADGSGTSSGRFWSLSAAINKPARLNSGAPAQLLEVLDRSVRRRLMGEAGYGVLLSGGVDSSTITALLARAAGSEFTAYTIDYPNPWKTGKSDRDYASLLTRDVGCRHRLIPATVQDYFDALAETVAIVEQPFNKAVATARLIYRWIGGREKVLLSGDGSDELFGGYLAAKGMQFDQSGISPDQAFPWTHHADLAMQLFDPDFVAAHRPIERIGETKKAALKKVSNLDPVGRYSYLYLRYFLPELLTLQDKVSLSCGIETRYPFLDRAMVRLAFALSAAELIDGGKEKAVVRQAARQLLPSRILDRGKSHLPIPRDIEALRLQSTMAKELLLSDQARIARYFRKDRLSAFLYGRGRFHSVSQVAKWQMTMYLITCEIHHRHFHL